MKLRTRKDYRRRRHLRLRQKIHGTPERPRVAVTISGRHMYVQFVDDVSGRTLASCSTLQLEGAGHNVSAAQQLGRRAAETARAGGFTQVVFDRSGHAYQGRVKAVAEAMREAGIKL